MFIKEKEVFRTWWKRNRSGIKGFLKSYRAVSPSGDIFQVDYNFHENLVRLSLSKKGMNYITTIKNGTIIRERDVSNGINVSLKGKFLPFKEIFSSIPDDDILDSISGVYDIYKLPNEKISTEVESFDEKLIEQNSLIPKISFKERFANSYRNLKLRLLDDIYDSILGVSLCVAIYMHYFDLVILGFALGFMGIFFGTLDWILRSRNPLLIKVISFLFTGGYYFYKGYTRF